jgi:hypothetical protein
MLQVGEMRMKALILQGLFIQLRSKCPAFWVFMAVACVVSCENLAPHTLSRPLQNCLIAQQVFRFPFFRKRREYKKQNLKMY